LDMLRTHREQLLFWKNIIEDQMANFSDAEGEDFLNGSLQRLLQQDPLLKEFFHMDEAVKHRERGFLKNSIKGFTGYLQAVADNP
jgi:hypothetical protein